MRWDAGSSAWFSAPSGLADEATFCLCPPQLLENLCATDIQLVLHFIYRFSSKANIVSMALLRNSELRPLSIIACLVLGYKGKSSSSALTGNSDWKGSWGDLSVCYLALPFDEYFMKVWYPHLQRFRPMAAERLRPGGGGHHRLLT